MISTAVSDIISPEVNFDALVDTFRGAEPFHHVVIDNFFEPSIAEGLSA